MLKKYILAAILINTYLLSIVALLYGVITLTNLSIPSIILLSIVLLISLIIIVYLYLSKKKLAYNCGIFLTLLLLIITSYKIYDLDLKYSYIENIFKEEYVYNTYNVYVNKSTTTYANISKLSGKKIGLLESNSSNVKSHLDKLVNIEYVTYKTPDELLIALDNGEVQSIIINDIDYEKINTSYTKNKNKIRDIYSHKIKDAI